MINLVNTSIWNDRYARWTYDFCKCIHLHRYYLYVDQSELGNILIVPFNENIFFNTRNEFFISKLCDLSSGNSNWKV